jgi:ClpP class serine protease
VAWERRGSNLYYYQGERQGGRVRKRYVGTGELAHIIAHAEETRRRVWAERKAKERTELDEARSLASAGDELYEAVEVLAVAEVVAAGFHRHKGQWRWRRGA